MGKTFDRRPEGWEDWTPEVEARAWFAVRLRKLRAARGLSQGALNVASGGADRPATVSDWEMGNSWPKNTKGLANVLGVSETFLLTGSEAGEGDYKREALAFRQIAEIVRETETLLATPPSTEAQRDAATKPEASSGDGPRRLGDHRTKKGKGKGQESPGA